MRRCAAIDGITLSEAERDHGESLAIAGYHIRLMNKYGPDLETLDGGYDFIIDNNPASFCCCMFHLESMLERYAALLAPGVDVRHPDMQKPEPRPKAIDEWLARWADLPGATWVKEIYAKHRPGRAPAV